MKKQLFILLLIAILGFISLSITSFVSKEYEVIGVVEGDLIYIDLNENKIKDKDELFHLKGINTFPMKYSPKNKIYMEKFNLNEKEIFGLGYLGKEFSENALLNKKIKFLEMPKEYNPDYEYRFGKISLNNQDYAKILLEEGLASAYWGREGIPYLKHENKNLIKENVKKAAKFNIKTEEKKETKDTAPILNKNIKTDTEIENLSLHLLKPNTSPNNKCTNQACKVLLSDIKSAKKSIDLAIYGIDKQDEIINALNSAKERGVKIRCVVDTDSKGEYTYPDTHKLENICEIKGDNTNHFMHNKFFIFDDEKVLTGSSNISNTGIGSYNSNSFVIIKNKDVVYIYKKEFEQMFNGKFQTQKADFSLENIEINKDTKVSVFFSPLGNIYEKVFKPLISNAQKSIYIDVFYLTHKEIAKDLINAHKRGVEIKIIIDATSAKNPKSKLKELRNAGINVKVENWGGKAHEKTMSIDETYLILGSANFTNSAMNYNDENVVVINNPALSKFYNQFFMELYKSIDSKYLTKIPSAEGLTSHNSCTDGIDNDFDGKIDKEDEGCRSQHFVSKAHEIVGD